MKDKKRYKNKGVSKLFVFFSKTSASKNISGTQTKIQCGCSGKCSILFQAVGSVSVGPVVSRFYSGLHIVLMRFFAEIGVWEFNLFIIDLLPAPTK